MHDDTRAPHSSDLKSDTEPPIPGAIRYPLALIGQRSELAIGRFTLSARHIPLSRGNPNLNSCPIVGNPVHIRALTQVEDGSWDAISS